MRTESGNLTAIGNAKNEPDARLAAVDQAAQHCEKTEKPAAIFKDSEINDTRKGKGLADLNLEDLPVIGKVFKGGDKTQVVLAFRCDKDK